MPKVQARTARNREALVQAARALFRARGFEATTIDEIAAAAGVSRRTFFRHFATKDAVVFPRADARIATFTRLLRPRRDEARWDAVRRAVLDMAGEFSRHADELLLQQELIASSPALMARELEVDRRWEEALFMALRDPARPDDLRARVLAGALLGAMRAALRAWFDGEGKQDLGVLGARALEALSSIGAASGAPA